MKIFPPGLLTEGNTSEEALILEARWLLAYHYKWDGRCIEASRVFAGTGRLNISDTLDVWNLYNQDHFNKSRRDYYISNTCNVDLWEYS